ncbi:MAG: o-succinylbenzoate--CoA ligase [Anaerolineae bacterium]|jgi:O-succinylbenzoic acid--CoA ligase|nr:o-succinylbenzoate--CoA ligase [Anaerolineae bacterium]
MQDWLAARAAASPDQIALVVQGNQWTYAALNALAAEYAAALHLLEVRAGDTVAVLSSSGLEFVGLVHAVARLRAVLLPLNTRLTVGELQAQLQQVGCRVLLHDDDDRAEALESDRHTTLSFTDTLLMPTSTLRDTFLSGDIFLDDPAAILFTSGTSGTPKGAVLTNGNFFYSAAAAAFHLGTLPDDRWLCVLPLYHVGGLSILYRASLYGICVDLHPRFEVERVQQALARQPITLVSLVPTMLHRLLAHHSGPWNAALRAVLLGGAAAPPELLARCQVEGIPVATTYGLTEAASQVATAPVNAISAPTRADLPAAFVGRPLLFNRVRIADEAGQTLPPDTPGEIVLSGPTLMQGYYNDPEATARALRGGELYTGDLGYVDAEGHLYILQRRSDLILTGGENVYPAEVERVLARHPAVAAVCVVGVPDAEWGQVVAALVALHPGARATGEALLALCREHLAGYKVPRRLKLVAALPLTASGKVDRRAAAALLED